MNRLAAITTLCLIVFFSNFHSAYAKKALGKWHKDENYDFKIRIPDEWEPEPISPLVENLIG
ncbi:MAG: hypothetical protein ABIK28_19230, partial [Planctomycetota bacterium]